MLKIFQFNQLITNNILKNDRAAHPKVSPLKGENRKMKPDIKYSKNTDFRWSKVHGPTKGLPITEYIY